MSDFLKRPMTPHRMGLAMALLFLAGWLLGSHAWSHVEVPETQEVRP